MFFTRYFTRFHAFGSLTDTGEHLEGGQACPTLHNGMLFLFFDHFSLIFRDFTRFHAFFTRQDVLGCHREARRFRKGWPASPTLCMVCYFDFLVIFNFIFHDLMCFSCVWMHVEALGVQENQQDT